MRSNITTLVLVLCLSAISILSAQKISIQGTLKDINGKAVPDNTALSVTFKIYANATGGTALWTETANVSVSGGVYSHYLGNVTALDPGTFTGVRFLGVTVNGSELSPRTELSYSPYALSVATAQGIANNTGTALFTNSGDLNLNKSLLFENNQSINGKNAAGTAQTCLVPRGTDDVTKLRYGNGGLILESNNGIHAMFLKSSPRNVGIGTINPQSRLDVWGNLTIGEAYAGVNAAPANGMIVEGKLGVGTPNPAHNFNVVSTSNTQAFNVDLSGNDALLQLESTATSNWVRFGTSGSPLAIFTSATAATDKSDGTTDFMISNTGKVGIGTNNPGAPLHVSLTSQNATTPSLDRTYFSEANLTNLAHNTSSSGDIAVRADGWYWAEGGGFVATSDKRIKNIIGVSDNKLDLETINKIQITDYTYIDKVANSPTTQKKVIAQQVNEIYPYAVKQIEGMVPNVYQIASKVKHTANETEITCDKIHDFKVGDKIKIIIENVGSKEVPVVKVLNPNTFVTEKISAENIFIYGKHVDDLLTVDYDALSMLNISATQELYNRIVALEAENTKLKTENKSLNDKQTSLETRLEKVEGFMKSIKSSTSSLD